MFSAYAWCQYHFMFSIYSWSNNIIIISFLNTPIIILLFLHIPHLIIRYVFCIFMMSVSFSVFKILLNLVISYLLRTPDLTIISCFLNIPGLIIMDWLVNDSVKSKSPSLFLKLETLIRWELNRDVLRVLYWGVFVFCYFFVSRDF